MTYKHIVTLEARLTIQTEEKMSLEELENILHELEYEVTSEYGIVTISNIDTEIASYNKSVK